VIYWRLYYRLFAKGMVNGTYAVVLNVVVNGDNKKAVLSQGEPRDAAVNVDIGYVSNFTTAAYVRFPCHSTANFLLVFACRHAVSHLSKSE